MLFYKIDVMAWSPISCNNSRKKIDYNFSIIFLSPWSRNKVSQSSSGRRYLSSDPMDLNVCKNKTVGIIFAFSQNVFLRFCHYKTGQKMEPNSKIVLFRIIISSKIRILMSFYSKKFTFSCCLFNKQVLLSADNNKKRNTIKHFLVFDTLL